MQSTELDNVLTLDTMELAELLASEACYLGMHSMILHVTTKHWNTGDFIPNIANYAPVQLGNYKIVGCILDAPEDCKWTLAAVNMNDPEIVEVLQNYNDMQKTLVTKRTGIQGLRSK